MSEIKVNIKCVCHYNLVFYYLIFQIFPVVLTKAAFI